MSVSNDMNFGLNTPQGIQNPTPVTMAAATTVAPTTLLTKLTGTTDVATITPPADGTHILILQWIDASPGDLLTTGNVLIGTTTITQYSIVLAVYNPIVAKYLVAKLT